MLFSYTSINLIFAFLYLLEPGSVTHIRPGSLSDAFFFSVQTLASVGYGVAASQTPYAHIVTAVETFVGLMFTAMMTGLVFVRFSKPKAKIIFADAAVVTNTDDGRRLLMIRIGNGRPSALTDVTARLTTLVTKPSSKGQTFSNAVDLKLARSDMPFFALIWTLVHELDDSSALNEALVRSHDSSQWLRLLLSISARDPALNAWVSAMKTYEASSLQLNTHYIDAVSWDGDDRSIADMRKISLTELDEAIEPGSTSVK